MAMCVCMCVNNIININILMQYNSITMIMQCNIINI